MPPPGAAHISSRSQRFDPAELTGTETLIKAAHLVLDNCGVAMSPSKVSRLVRDYQRHVAANGFSFFAYLANAVQLSAEQQRTVMLNPDIARVVSYSDPTGEAAVNHVLRQRRRGGDAR